MNLLITGAWQQASQYIPELETQGHRISFLQYETGALPCDAAWVEGIIGNGIFLSHPIECFVNLRYIQLTSAGYDRVPMDYVKSHNITIHNARGVYSIPMAEFAVSGVLSLFKETRGFDDSQKRHQWEKRRGLRELHGKTVVIVGCGNVGTECAKRFHAFGTKVVGVDLFVREDAHYNAMRELRSLDETLTEADIVILTLPLTEETRGLMNATRLSGMKTGAILVNIARGGVVDEKALIEALQNHLGGAVLDVFETEPLAENSPLWDMPHVIVTPHNSFVGEGNGTRLSQVILENLKDFS